jgi:adenylate cyclase
MEGLNKHLGTTILLTRETNDVMGDKFITRMVGHFRLKGFDRTVEVYELLGETDNADSTEAWREAFAHALGQFQKMKLQAAEAAFHAALELNPSDGPSHFYLERIEEFRVHPAPADWRGEIELKEK